MWNRYVDPYCICMYVACMLPLWCMYLWKMLSLCACIATMCHYWCQLQCSMQKIHAHTYNTDIILTRYMHKIVTRYMHIQWYLCCMYVAWRCMHVHVCCLYECTMCWKCGAQHHNNGYLSLFVCIVCICAVCARSMVYNTMAMTICQYFFAFFFVCEQHVHELFKLASAPWKQTLRGQICMSLESICRDTRSQKDKTHFISSFVLSFRLATAK